MMVTPSFVYACNQTNDVNQYRFSGELLQTLTTNEHKPAAEDWFIRAVDFDRRMALAVDCQLVK